MNTYIERCDEFKSLLKERLKEERYFHSLCVADSARELARQYGYNEDRAYMAGLLHDVTKNENSENQLQMLSDSAIILSQTEKNNFKLWHSMTAPIYVKKELGIDDEEFLGALRYHTTGKANMSLLEMIVYIADYISAERDYPDVDVMRRLSKESLEKAALYSLKYTLKKLSDGELVIHENSLEFYNDLILKGVTLGKD
ncbi:MAG: bis(5'-nucleosyl)-tetraphosphatase (symmetrical) YqeK [Clostridia bacterium]|nr:bis(5'-nucleosyl)-tetraphosphatase (symmetrical) YqeK [Clostridia bacterium]MBQ8029876.1 bis(5'-nucleosyl)-tetraphosphatase (symmetrical) YqeK [Clostridia bacterium]